MCFASFDISSDAEGRMFDQGSGMLIAWFQLFLCLFCFFLIFGPTRLEGL